MVRGLRNWKYEDVVSFLKDHGFEETVIGHKKATSHHFFKGCILGKYYQVHVQYHAGKTIPVGTMNAIISTSGIPKKEWTIR